MNIIKATGEPERFDKQKVFRTAVKAGATQEFAREVANKVEAQVIEGMHSKEVLKLALKYLRKKRTVAEKYSLKQALMQLGPTGFPFEEYFAKVLQFYGYSTQVGRHLRGARVEQEIDILAKKDGKSNMIECKYKNNLSNHTDLKVAMYTYARFLDVKKYADFAWLVTNTKCTTSAIKYASGVNLKIIGWSYPKKGNLQDLISKKALYPTAVLLSVKGEIKNILSRSKISLVKELAEMDLRELKKRTGLGEKDLMKIKRDAQELLKN